MIYWNSKSQRVRVPALRSTVPDVWVQRWYHRLVPPRLSPSGTSTESSPEGVVLRGPSAGSEGRGDATPWKQCSPGVHLRSKKKKEGTQLLFRWLKKRRQLSTSPQNVAIMYWNLMRAASTWALCHFLCLTFIVIGGFRQPRARLKRLDTHKGFATCHPISLTSSTLSALRVLSSQLLS